MILENMSPVAIAGELGGRLRQVRLNANLTQAEVAERAGLSRRSILNAENGKVQLENFIAILTALDAVDQLNMFLPVQEISPVQLARLKSKQRQRASKAKGENAGIHKDKTSW